jgi:Transglutaminase-like superfamily
MRPYQLADDTYACVTASSAVLLDLRADAYFGLDAQQSQALAGLVEGWPEPPHPHPAIAGAQQFARSLCERGLLCEAPAGQPARPPLLETCSDELIAWDEMARFRTTAGHVFSFIRAVLEALILLNGLSLRTAVRYCEKQRRRRMRSAGTRLDMDAARRLLSAYTHLRTIFFVRRGHCLLDSVALLRFLSYYGFYPRWVLGVKQRPFAAHSWVQHEQWVLNGTPVFVRMYRPILVV